MTLTAIHHVHITIPTGAEAAARAFYCGVLGLEEIAKPESLQGRGGFWLQAGADPLHVGVEDGVDRLKTKAHVAYQVTGLDGWRMKLIQHGITVEDSIPIPDYARFEFRDPFGNRVELIERTG
jgi:catechol 2,3-dioxygenase-like lactoylglutathione lyase family enzyme